MRCIVTYICNLSTWLADEGGWELEAGIGLSQSQGMTGLNSNVQARQTRVVQ